MSRIGRRPIPLPSGVTVAQADGLVTVAGPKGELARTLAAPITVREDSRVLYVERPTDLKPHKALHGLTRTLVANMVEGVTNGFSRVLRLHGIGYRAQMQGDRLVLNLGFSHDVTVVPPKGITIELQTFSPNVDNQYCTSQITVSGINKELVGQVAARVRALKKPEPYKGKGLRYFGEVVRRKAGKAAKAGKK